MMKLNFFFVLTVLIFTDAQAKPKKPKKWRPPLEFGPKTTGIYSSLQRSHRRKINVDLLDPYDDRTKAPRARLSGTSYKPGTWNWHPNMDIPGYSYKFRIFNLTKDQAGSYMGMHDYRKNYGPLYNTRFGGTYPPIPPLLGDPRQPRLAWYLKKYTPPTPSTSYIDHIMDTIKDGQIRDRLYEKQLEPDAEWYTVKPKNESNYFYEEVKIKPRFGDYGGIGLGLNEAFPAYKPKEQYEVVMVPERQPIYKRSAEHSSSKEDKEKKEKPKSPKNEDSFSSNWYTYERFDSDESIKVPFSPEKFSSSSSEHEKPLKAAKISIQESAEEQESRSSLQLSGDSAPYSRSEAHPTIAASAENNNKKSKRSVQESDDDPYSKSKSFPSPLNTGESGWGAKPPAGKDSEIDISGISKDSLYKDLPSESDEEKKKKSSKNKTPNNTPTQSVEASFPRMKPENDSEVQRDSSGLENESFPSVSGSHSSDLDIWNEKWNITEEFKTAETSEMESSGDLSKYQDSSEIPDFSHSKDDKKKGSVKDKKKNKSKKHGKTGNKSVKKGSVKDKTKKNPVLGVGVPPGKNKPKMKLSDDDKGSNYDSDASNPWGDISFVDDVTADPPDKRTFPPSFNEPYVAPLHHQPDEFWDEIYKPDGPDPTLAPYQIEEEEIRKATTTWKPPIITTRDPTAKPKFIYITKEDSKSSKASVSASSEETDKKHTLTRTEQQLRQVMKLKNKARGLRNLKNKLKPIDLEKALEIEKLGTANQMEMKGRDKGRKEKKKPKKKDKEKKPNPNNFSRPNPDHIKVQGNAGQSEPQLHAEIQQLGMGLKGRDKGRKEKKKPKKKDKEKKPNPNNYSRPNPDHIKVVGRSETQANIVQHVGMDLKGKDKGKKEKMKPKAKDKEKKPNPNNFSRPNADHLKVEGRSETKSVVTDPLLNILKGNVIGDPLNKMQKGGNKIEEPKHLNDPQIYAAVTPFEPDYSFSESRPEGNYEWPSIRHPNFNPETAYDEEGYPVHESPDWTSPTTHRKDRIFGKEKAKGVRGRGINMAQFLKRTRVHSASSNADIAHSQDHKIQPGNVHNIVNAKMKQNQLKRQELNKFQVNKDEALNPLLHGNQNLFKAGPHLDTTKDVRDEAVNPSIHPINLLEGMQKGNLGNVRAKRSMRKNKKKEIDGTSPLLHDSQNMKDIDHNALLYGNRNSKENEGLNPLLYGNQNLFSANHNDYIKLSDIFSPNRKPPYGIPIDVAVKVYDNNDLHEAPSPVFAKNQYSLESRPQTYLEKLNLLKRLKEERVRLQAAARLQAPPPPRFRYTVPDPTPKHVIHKRGAWDAEKFHPMLYGQKGIFKPKHGEDNSVLANKNIQWMPYVDMQATRLFTSNPSEARARLHEYSKLAGRDVNKLREAIRLRNERRRRQQQNPKMLPENHHNSEYRKQLIRNGIQPGNDFNIGGQIPLKIKQKNEIDEQSWMPYVNMNAVVARALKKNQGHHRIHKRDIGNAVADSEAQQPFAVTSGYRRKRTTSKILNT